MSKLVRVYVESFSDKIYEIYEKTLGHDSAEEFYVEFLEKVVTPVMSFVSEELTKLGLKEEKDFSIDEGENQNRGVKAHLDENLSEKMKKNIEKIVKEANDLWDELSSPYLDVEAVQRDNRIQILSIDGKLIRRLEGLHEEGNNVNSVTFSPDGRLLASVDDSFADDNAIILSDVKTGETLKKLTRAGGVDSIAFSPDGRFLASGHLNGDVKLWDVESGKELHTFRGHKVNARSVSFSPDGRFLASGSDDTMIRIWDINRAKNLRTLTGHSHSVKSIAFSPDSQLLASGGFEGRIKLWDVETWEEIQTLNEERNWINSMAFSPDGKLLAVGGRYVSLWDVERGIIIKTIKEGGKVNSIAFSPDGKLVTVGEKIILWDVNGTKLWKRYYGIDDYVYANSVAFSPDGRLLAVGGDWDDEDYELVKEK